MSNNALVIELPEDLAQRLRRIAADKGTSLQSVVIDYLRELAAADPPLPDAVRAELDALARLSDDALWTIAREQMPPPLQARAEQLMTQQAALSDDAQAELDALAARADRLMLRKAEAAALLMARGHAFAQQDFKAQDA